MTDQEAFEVLRRVAAQWVENWEELIPDLEEVGPSTSDEQLQAIVAENPDDGGYQFEEAALFRRVRAAMQQEQVTDPEDEALKVLASVVSDWLECNAKADDEPYKSITAETTDEQLSAMSFDAGDFAEHKEWRDAKRALHQVFAPE